MSVTALGQGGGVDDQELKKLAEEVREWKLAKPPARRWRPEHTTYSGLAGLLLAFMGGGKAIADKVDTHKAELATALAAQTKELQDLRLEVATTRQLVGQIDEARRLDRAEVGQLRQDLQKTREDVSALRAQLEGRK